MFRNSAWLLCLFLLCFGHTLSQSSDVVSTSKTHDKSTIPSDLKNSTSTSTSGSSEPTSKHSVSTSGPTKPSTSTSGHSELSTSGSSEPTSKHSVSTSGPTKPSTSTSGHSQSTSKDNQTTPESAKTTSKDVTTSEPTESTYTQNTTITASFKPSTSSTTPTPSTASTTPIPSTASTTPTPSTTSATTSTPSTTTEIPVPPQPPQKGSWNVIEKGSSCLMIEGVFSIDYVKNGTKAHLDVPPTARSYGDCSKGNIVLTWRNNTNNLEFHFEKNGDKYYLKSFSGSIFIPPSEIKFNTNNNQEHFETPVGQSYSCGSIKQIAVDDHVKVTLDKFQLQAFKSSNTTSFDSSVDCSGTTHTPDIVPIVVGCVLALLVIAVLAAYLISRRRSLTRGYLSM